MGQYNRHKPCSQSLPQIVSGLRRIRFEDMKASRGQREVRNELSAAEELRQ